MDLSITCKVEDERATDSPQPTQQQGLSCTKPSSITDANCNNESSSIPVEQKNGETPIIDLRLIKKEKVDGFENDQTVESKHSISNPSMTKSSVKENINESISDERVQQITSNLHHRKDTDPYSYRVPIVYPIQSPPIDFRQRDHSPRTKEYRLGKESPSPKQLYEETGVENPKETDGCFEDSPGFSYSFPYSPKKACPPLNLSQERKDQLSAGVPSNAEEKATGTKRKRNVECLPLDTEKEEESLWKQVQRYRHRKRLPLGKLMATQEETIFMQYNELRERRQREGKGTSNRQAKLNEHQQSDKDLSREIVHSPNEFQNERENSNSGIQRQESVSPQLSDSAEKLLEPPPSFVTRQRLFELPPGKKNVAYVYVAGQAQSSVTCSKPEIFPAIYNNNDGDSINDCIQSQTNNSNCGYHRYVSADLPRRRIYESCGIERGRPLAMEYRRFVPVDEYYHDSDQNQRLYCSTSRYRQSDNCHGNRKRRLHEWDSGCCRSRKHARPFSSDEEECNNDDLKRWCTKEKLHRLQSRENGDIYYQELQNASQQNSPSSVSSRESGGLENEQSQNKLTMEKGQNIQLSKERDPGVNDSNENNSIVNISKSDLPRACEPAISKDEDIVCQVNGLFSLPGYRETKYDITKGELMRRTGLPETLTRVEMISYVRQAKTSGRLLLDSNGITTSNRSHPTILSRVCEREAQVLACGIHKMNLEYLPIKRLVQLCVDIYRSRGCDGCQDCRMKLRRRLVDIEITRNTLKELHNVLQDANDDGIMESFDLASHTFGTLNLTNHLKLLDEYYKELLLALDRE